MGDVSAALRDYVREYIALPKEDIEGASTSRDWFLRRIKLEIERRTLEPLLFTSQPFLKYGSYFKGTKVGEVDEFDVLVVIDSNTGVFSWGGEQIGDGQGSADPNHKYGPAYRIEAEAGVSPTKLLNWLKDVVETVVAGFDGEAPIRDGQAITAVIKSKDLRIDLVPAGIFTRRSDGQQFYNIPRGDKDNGWILTAPELDMQRIDDLAEGRDEFRNVIRLVKRIKDTYTLKVSSFAVETAVCHFAQSSEWRDDLYTDLSGALAHCADALRLGHVADIFNSGENLIDGVESREWYAERLESIRAELESCLSWADEDRVWRKVYRLMENE